MDGGHLLESPEKAGTASFLASMMMEGTATKTPEELEEAIDMLGANINVGSGTETMSISVNCLARNFEKTLALVQEILLQPRWDEEQFGLIKSRMLTSIKRNQADASYLANVTLNKLIYGEGSIMAVPASGTLESVESITMDDLKTYYQKNFSPKIARMHIVGQIAKDRVVAGLASLQENWKPVDVVIPALPEPKAPEKSAIYFVNVPGAKQSVINIGCGALPQSNSDFYPVNVMNYKLGGSFNGIVNLILREEKGYTYGARTGYSGGKNYGQFSANASVMSGATRESLQIFKEEMEKYINGIDQGGLQFTKDALLKSNARRFETLGSLHDMLYSISTYNSPFDYVKKEEAFVKNLTPEQHKEIAQKYLHPEKMYYVVVGDAETQLKELSSIGMGKPVLMN
jgi:zinc protease